MSKNDRDMRVIPEPAPNSRTVFASISKGPVVKSQGPLNYKCGCCSTTLIETVAYKQVQNIVIRCGVCGSHNEIPAEHHAH